MKRILFFALLLHSLCGFSQVDKDLDNYIKAKKDAQDAYIKKMQEDYNNYVKKEQEAYNTFLRTRAQQWGKGNVKESTQKDWVEYSKDGKSRSIVDFESGEATLEIILEPGKNIDKKEIATKLKDLLTNKGTTKDYDSEVEKAIPLQDKPVLENQVATPSGKIVTEKNLDKDVNEIVENIKPEVTTITGEDKVQHQVVTIKFDLVPDHIKISAEQYKNEVAKYCQKWNVDPALAYAVMHTESNFNPKAKSSAPAYGLMQIVPTSAGAECAKHLKKPFEIPTANYLYEPENNIEMGVYYLHHLMSNYYKKITDKNSQTLCVIASYNTGAGNLSKALRGDKNISKAIPQINDMNYDELFKFLEQKLLPETQKYIRKVTERMTEYKAWLK